MEETLIVNNSAQLQKLYNSYAYLLFGCISEVANDVSKEPYPFHSSYYYGKTIEEISIELNQPEASIRKSLRQAFAIIKTGSGN